MVSLKPLNNLYHKYKEKNFALISISDRDSRKMIEDFKKSCQIPFPMRGEARATFDAYHLSVSPTFYFIGKDGKIAQVQEGYNDSFESKAMEIIEGLLQL
ncbi:MAG: redoxin domain-containing protein [Bacteroidota bacterium]